MTAADDDNTVVGGAEGAVDTLTYTVEGADAKHFTITNDDGALSIRSTAGLLGATGADYETKGSYSINIVATSTGSEDD